jgi:alpha/beta superfamily hydrolase
MSPMAPADAEVVEVVEVRSGDLSLEGRLAYPDAGRARGAVAIAGPHPLLGGDLDNNVVAGLTAGLARRGYTTLAFNYRGVGGSAGPPPDVSHHLAEFWATSHVAAEPGYRDDLVAALAHLRDIAGAATPVGLVGYSFGCSLLPAATPAGGPMVLIAPTVGTHDYETFAGHEGPLLVIAPDGDFAADATGLRQWFDRLPEPKRLLRGRWDDHFFRGHEDWLAGTVAEFLAEAFGGHG